MNAIREFISNAFLAMPTFGIWDAIDVLLVAGIIYAVLHHIHLTSASRILRVIIGLLLISWVTELLHLNVLNYLLGLVMQVGILALIILFQPELRRGMERLGSANFRRWLRIGQNEDSELERAIQETVDACARMSREKIGALIVFERIGNVSEYCNEQGTPIDATLSSQLLRSLFFPNSSLHDGAVIIRDCRVASAGAVLRLTQNPNISSDLGTRHRAGIGLSEVTDAAVVIVSEESGTISVATEGNLRRPLKPETLYAVLRQELGADAQPEKEHGFHRFARRSMELLQKLKNRGGQDE